ncbi:translesion error-prone DNA polymerase V subunit UmuC [Erwinia sp. V71]|uniref:translesion error-prone DNA polymerase V subunit UmuC n=1 Tax=Erwinia sp. V71 TaxID=3369424 RepID=UPI003F60C479
MFALVDVNNFYASCETVFRPDLRGKPVVVLSNNDGCVIARNAEAKALGISMTAPYFKQKALFERHQVHVFSSNYALYGDMSHRVMSLLEEMAPATEVYSIDEAFLCLQGVSHCQSLLQFGEQVRQRVAKEAHLSVGVGIAPTKTLAKLANYAVKAWQMEKGVLDLSRVTLQRRLLARVAVGEVWGVGRRLSNRLQLMGIETALQLAESSPAFIRKNFNVVLERTVRELRGEPCLLANDVPSARQQILCSRSFSSRISDYTSMREAVCAYAERAAEKLRTERQYCRQVGVFIRTSPHATDEVFYTRQAQGSIAIPSQDTRDIIRVAMDCLDRIWAEGHRYMKAGVVLGDFFSQGVAQLNLFDEWQPRANSSALMQVIDKVNQQGKGKLWFAGQGFHQPWAMKREMLSPAYTTRFSDLPRAS